MRCSASPRLIAENAERIVRDSSTYADEGTEAHALAAEAFILGYDKDCFPNEEMAECVLDYINYCRSHLTADSNEFIEGKIRCFYKKEQIGYVDYTAADSQGFTIVDLKYGAGISVSIEDNEQLLIYGRSVYEWLTTEQGFEWHDDHHVKLAIFQPRIRGEEAVREIEMTVGELIDKTDVIGKEAKRIQRKGAKLTFCPGADTCQWCDAKPFCGAYAKYLLDDIPQGKKLLQKNYTAPPNKETLGEEQILRLLKRFPELSKWVTSINDYIFHRLLAGEKFPGFKLIATQPNRKWEDEDEVWEYLEEHLEEDDFTTFGIISPAQAEKLLKKKKVEDYQRRMEELAPRPEGGPKLAFADDPKPEWVDVQVEDEFEALD